MLVAAAMARGAATDADAAKGFNHFYNLEFEESIAIFSRLAAANPDDAELHNHLAQAILYREMLNAGALETELVTGGNAFLRREKMNPSQADRKRFHDANNTAIRLSQAAIAKRPNDQWAHYHLGVAYGLLANYNFLVNKAWMDALRDATRSRTEHNRVTEIDPSMVDARMTQGIHDYIVGGLPWYYRALGFLTGFAGNKTRGIETLQLVYREGKRNRMDAAILLATVYRRERRPREAVPLLNELIREFPRNYLLRLELAQMFSDLGDKEKALGAIAEVERLKAEGSSGFAKLPVEKIYYFRGTVQFWYMDLDAAVANFERVTPKAADLDPNTGVTAWLRLGQVHDLKGERQKALRAYRAAIDYAPGSYVAKQAAEYMKAPYRRSRG